MSGENQRKEGRDREAGYRRAGNRREDHGDEICFDPDAMRSAAQEGASRLRRIREEFDRLREPVLREGAHGMVAPLRGLDAALRGYENLLCILEASSGIYRSASSAVEELVYFS